MTFTCPKCGHIDSPPDGPPPEESVLQCGECGAWIAYGELMPRLMVAPEGSRWIVVSFDEQTYKLPRVLADALAVNLRSLTDPSAR